MTSSGKGRARLPKPLAAEHRRLVVVDAVSDADLLAIGQALRDAVLVTGGSGIALGLPQNFRDAGLLAPPAASFQAVHGPAVVLSGSCSTQSRLQLAHHLERHPGIAIVPGEIIAGALSPDAVADALWSLRAESPIAYSTAPQQPSKPRNGASAPAPPRRSSGFSARSHRGCSPAGSLGWWSAAAKRRVR